jgi:hypothetical protein
MLHHVNKDPFQSAQQVPPSDDLAYQLQRVQGFQKAGATMENQEYDKSDVSAYMEVMFVSQAW